MNKNYRPTPPYKTPSNAADRTYRFRVEFEHDLYPLVSAIGWCLEEHWRSPREPWGEAECKVTVEPDGLSLDEVRWVFDQVVDCHVAMQTLALDSDYTGARSYLEAHEMGAKAPAREALLRCAEGLQTHIDGLNAMAERAQGAADAIEAAAALSAVRTITKRRAAVPAAG